MSNKTIDKRQLSPSEVALRQTMRQLDMVDQTKHYHVKTRFVGLLNAYKDDPEAIEILNLLMAEYALKNNIEREKNGI